MDCQDVGSKHGLSKPQTIVAAAVVCAILLAVCGWYVSKRADIVRNAEVTASHDISADGARPVSITDQFTDRDRLCVSARFRLSENLPTVVFSDGSTVREVVTFSWHVPNAAAVDDIGVVLTDLGGGWRAGGLCMESGDLPHAKGRYVVKASVMRTEIGQVVFWVQ